MLVEVRKTITKHWLWLILFAVAVVIMAVLRLWHLGTVPSGLYSDEASTGYNGWAIAHYGIDEHGAHFPLFFEDFGDWKGPIFTYFVALICKLVPLSVAVDRLPSVLAGIALYVIAGLIAWKITGSKLISLTVLLTAGLQPWAIQESRLGLEANMMEVLCIMGVIWALANAETTSRRWFLIAGIWAIIGLFAYTPARLFILLLAGLIVVCYLQPANWRVWTRQFWQHTSKRWSWFLFPVIMAYSVIWMWSLQHPGALTQRFDAISIFDDHPTMMEALGRFFSNYASYLSASFLFIQGDTNLRHHTGFGGMLLLAIIPAFLLGIATCIQQWREPLSKLALLGLLISPIPASLTNPAEGVPNSLRSNVMLTFILLITIYGWGKLLELIKGKFIWLAPIVAVTVLQIVPYTVDMFNSYPARAAVLFDAGQGPAIAQAYKLAHGQPVHLSNRLDRPDIQALFYLQLNPNLYLNNRTSSSSQAVLQYLHMVVEAPDTMDKTAKPGELLVLMPNDKAPSGSKLLFTEILKQDTVVENDRPSTASTNDILVSVWQY